MQTFVVTKTTDSDDGSCDANDCSLREAITRANTLSTDDTITFKSSANGTITLGSALPALANNGTLTITGNGRTNTIVNGIVSGGNTVRVFRVASGATVKIANMTITKGDGGIENYGGTLTVTSCSISGNSTALGGGIANVSVLNHDATLTVTNSTISGNSAQGQGGGISTSIDSVTTVNNSTISGNSAAFGGGIDNIGTLNLNNSIVANSTGGGDCDNDTEVGAVVNARNSLIEEGLGCVNGTNVANLKRDPALNADLTPSKFSRAINAGDNALIPAGITHGSGGQCTHPVRDRRHRRLRVLVQRPHAADVRRHQDGRYQRRQLQLADCSLREAITAANAAGSDDTITFAAGANGTITLGSALPVLASDGTLTITGNGAANTVISGGNNVGVFKVASDGTVKISGDRRSRSGKLGREWRRHLERRHADGDQQRGQRKLDDEHRRRRRRHRERLRRTLTVTNSTFSGNSAELARRRHQQRRRQHDDGDQQHDQRQFGSRRRRHQQRRHAEPEQQHRRRNSDNTVGAGDDDCDNLGYAGATVDVQNSLIEGRSRAASSAGRTATSPASPRSTAISR